MNGGSASSSIQFPPPPAAAAPPVHDSIASVSAINEQQQHPPPLPPLPPLPGVFPLLWDRGDPKVESLIQIIELPALDSHARWIGLTQRIPTVNSVLNHLTGPPSNQNTSNSYDPRSCRRGQENVQRRTLCCILFV